MIISAGSLNRPGIRLRRRDLVEISSRASLVIAEIHGKVCHWECLSRLSQSDDPIVLCGVWGLLGRYRDRIEMLAGSVSIINFEIHGPLLQVLGDRAYMSDELRARPES